MRESSQVQSGRNIQTQQETCEITPLLLDMEIEEGGEQTSKTNADAKSQEPADIECLLLLHMAALHLKLKLKLSTTSS